MKKIFLKTGIVSKYCVCKDWLQRRQKFFKKNYDSVFFFYLCGGTFGYCGHYWTIVPAPDDRWWWLWRNWWKEDWQGKPKKYSEKTCPSATLSTTNPKVLDPGLNPGRRGGKPATNRLSYIAAYESVTREVFYNILTESGVPMKVVRLIEPCLRSEKQ
jgi:hypothetical protein